MQLSEILTLNCTKSAVQCTSKKRALEMISEIVAEQTGQSSNVLFECMLNREKMGSTGIGNGIAIPHARMQSSDKAIAVLVLFVSHRFDCSTKIGLSFQNIGGLKLFTISSKFFPLEKLAISLSLFSL